MATDKQKIQDFKDSGFGKYKEANGGGTPVGGVYGGPNGRVGWKERGEPGHRESQPRDKFGHFTYNSVNGKELAPSSDPNRGKTVNPLLTGGDGTVHIRDVEKQFDEKSGSYWDKYKDSWYKGGGEFVTASGKTVVAAKPIWQVARGSYDSVKGEFKGESEAFSTKKGRPDKDEKAAKEKVQATGEEQAVINQADGAVKVKKGTPKDAPTYITPKNIKTFMEDKEMPGAESVTVGEEKESEVTPTPSAITPTENDKPFGSGKYTMGQAKAVKNEIKAKLGDSFDEDTWDDATIEEFIDANGGEKMFAPVAPKEDSESVKKIKDLGFSA